MRANGTLLWQQTRRKENADNLNDRKGRRRRGSMRVMLRGCLSQVRRQTLE